MHLGAVLNIPDLQKLGLTAGPAEDIAELPEAERSGLGLSFEQAGIIPAQTGGYCNLVSTDEAHRRKCVARLRETLAAAEQAGVRTVICGGGHRDPDCPEAVFSPHPDNWTQPARELLAQSCAEVLDGFSSKVTKLTIETWVMTPLDSPRAARDLVDAVKHPNLGILFDPVNMMNLDRHFRTGEFVAECIDTFGDAITHVHAKDTRILADRFTYHMAEVPIGSGRMDYARLLREMTRLPEDVSLIIEHLDTFDAYAAAAAKLREIAAAEGIDFAGKGRAA